jgi:hypothetical protein
MQFWVFGNVFSSRSKVFGSYPLAVDRFLRLLKSQTRVFQEEPWKKVSERNFHLFLTSYWYISSHLDGYLDNRLGDYHFIS